MTDVPETYRFASSAPWYVEIGEEPKRISKASASFFVDWVDERREVLEQAGELSEMLRAAWDAAKNYWEKIAAEANAD